MNNKQSITHPIHTNIFTPRIWKHSSLSRQFFVCHVIFYNLLFITLCNTYRFFPFGAYLVNIFWPFDFSLTKEKNWSVLFGSVHVARCTQCRPFGGTRYIHYAWVYISSGLHLQRTNSNYTQIKVILQYPHIFQHWGSLLCRCTID